MIASILFGLGISGAAVAACYTISYAVTKLAEAERGDLNRDQLTQNDWPVLPSVETPFHPSSVD